MADTPDKAQAGLAGERPRLYVNLTSEVDALTTAFGDAIDSFNFSLTAGTDPDVAAEDFLVKVRALEAVNQDNLGVFANSRRLVAQQLILRGRVDKAVEVIATMARAEDICVAASELQLLAIQAGGVEAAGQIEDGVMALLDATAPEKALGFLRHTRRLMLGAALDSAHDTDELLTLVDDEMVKRVGASYEPIADWAAAEAERYPRADWPELVAIIRDDSLWGADTPLSMRLYLTLDLAQPVDYLLSRSVDAVRNFDRLFKELRTKNAAIFSNMPAKSYLDGIMAVAFYRQGLQNEARTIIKAIKNSGAMGYVAEALLRLEPPAVTDAQKLALAANDGRVTIDLLLDGSWPDRTVPDHLLDEIIVISTRRTGGGKGPIASQHPIGMRIECLLALAERRDSEGSATEAAEYRRRAEQLKWQQANKLIKHMPRK